MSSQFFHGIENMTLDEDSFLRWKGIAVERFEPDFAQTAAARGKARILAARCRHLEAMGKDVNKFNVVLNWQGRVKQKPAGAERER